MLLALGLRTPGRPRRRCRDGRDRRALARVLMPNLRLAPRPRPTTPVASIHATASPRRIGATASGGRGSVKAAVALGRSRWKASDRSRETCTPGATGISGVTSPSSLARKGRLSGRRQSVRSDDAAGVCAFRASGPATQRSGRRVPTRRAGPVLRATPCVAKRSSTRPSGGLHRFVVPTCLMSRSSNAASRAGGGLSLGLGGGLV